MAIYDNKHWLLSHIRNSFISTDDTGMCEVVMLGEDLPRMLHMKAAQERGRQAGEVQASPSYPLHHAVRETSDDEYIREQIMDFDCYPDMDQTDEDDPDPLTETYELQHDMDFGMHRQRSNTAQKLEKMEAAQRKAAKIRIIKWENPPVVLTDQEKDQIFIKKDSETIRKQVRKKAKSLLADQLEKCPSLPQSQYAEFAKYDGTAQFGLPTKTYKIFMTMLPEEHRNYPVTTCVVASAKILDLIGFTCYKYSIQHPECGLGPVSQYGLYICEDDGEVDWYFPCIDNREACSKFVFTSLALVDLKSNAATKNNEAHMPSVPDKGGLNMITVAPEEKSNNELSVRSRSATFDSKDKLRNREDSISSTLKNTANITGGGGMNRMDKASGVANLARFGESKSTRSEDIIKILTFSNMGGSKGDFSGGKQPSSSPQEAEALNRMKVHEKVIEAPLYQPFLVRVVTRIVSNPLVCLGISGDRIEIDPINTSSNMFWPRMKPISHNIDSVAWCELHESKPSRSTFRIVYSHNHPQTQNPEPSPSSGSSHHHNIHPPNLNFKHHDFESDFHTANEIVEKINRILNLQSSSCHKEYKAVRERKSMARRSFHLPRTS